MTDSARTGWSDYLDEAERNRNAVAALGLVRTADQNGGQSIRMMGARRIVMAFDPESDDPDLLRTVVMLLRTMAVAASSRVDAVELATVEEKVRLSRRIDPVAHWHRWDPFRTGHEADRSWHGILAGPGQELHESYPEGSPD